MYAILPIKKISGDKTQFYDSLYFICLWFLIFFKWFMCAILLCFRIVSFDKRGKNLLCINVAMELF